MSTHVYTITSHHRNGAIPWDRAWTTHMAAQRHAEKELECGQWVYGTAGRWTLRDGGDLTIEIAKVKVCE